jgi:hypothetical protein
MRRINIISRHLDRTFLRQTPGRAGRWGDCVFEVTAPGGSFDGIVAYDDFTERLSFDCPPEATVFVTGEPPSIKTYHPGFLAQFHRVVTPHSDIAHPRVIDSHCGMPWHIGMSFVGGTPEINLDYDALSSARPEKTRLLSIVASHRNVTSAHRQRPALVEALQRRFGKDIAVFGREYDPVADKWDAIAPFRYHIALENGRFANYWTEKLSDAFLGGAFPFYWGCPNIGDYFPSDSLAAINIFDIDATVRAIEQAIARDAYAQSAAARAEARHAVLTSHNFFAVVDGIFRGLPSARPQPCTILPEAGFRDGAMRQFRKRLRRAVPRSLRPKRWKV